MNSSLRVSIIIPTRDRAKDLAELLSSILEQNCAPFEVIIVDDSVTQSANQVFKSSFAIFRSIGCELKYITSKGEGLPAARNLGIKRTLGDAILFLDDDILLSDRNAIKVLADFLEENTSALGVQPMIISPHERLKKDQSTRLENAIYKAFMLTYNKENTSAVRRSSASVLPNSITRTIQAQRLAGCCCFRREVFTQFQFDTNLKRWGYMEDLDFSYRVYKKNPKALYVIPYTEITHKRTAEGRMPARTTIHMTTVYWFYIFFKDIFEGSALNLIAFLWALTGSLIANIGSLIIERKSKHEQWTFISLLSAYVTAFKNLRSILLSNLEFLNRNLGVA